MRSTNAEMLKKLKFDITNLNKEESQKRQEGLKAIAEKLIKMNEERKTIELTTDLDLLEKDIKGVYVQPILNAINTLGRMNKENERVVKLLIDCLKQTTNTYRNNAYLFDAFQCISIKTQVEIIIITIYFETLVLLKKKFLFIYFILF